MSSRVTLTSRQRRQQDARLLRRLISLVSKASLHGLSRLCSSETSWWPGQLAWFAVVLAASLGLCLHIWTEVNEYRQYPVSSNSKLLLNSFQFPDVTLCNPENPMKQRAFQLPYMGSANDKLQSRSGVWHDPALMPLYRFEHYINFTKMGTFPEDLVVYCRYNHQPCSYLNFTLVFDRSYGNCFTFKPDERRLRRPYMEYGLILILYDPASDAKLENANLVGKIGYKMRPREMAFSSEGYLVTLHSGGTRPHPLEDSHSASLGRVTTVTLEQQDTHLANTPNNPCQPRATRPTYDAHLARVINYTDTLNDCVQWQRSLSVMRRCGCIPEGPVRLEDFPDTGSVPYCHLLVKSGEFRGKAESDFIGFVQHNVSWKTHKISLSDLRSRYQAVYRRYRAFTCFHESAALDAKWELDAAAAACPDMCQSESYTAAISSGVWPHSIDDVGSDDSIKQMLEVTRLLNGYIKTPQGPRSLLGRSLALRNLSFDYCCNQLYQWQLDSPVRRASAPIQAALKRCGRVREFVRRHFLLLKIYPKSLTVRLLQVERSFLAPQLLSRIGGSLGLWIGSSLISLFECAEVLATLAAYCAFRCLAAFRLVGSLGFAAEASAEAEADAEELQTPLHRRHNGTGPGSARDLPLPTAHTRQWPKGADCFPSSTSSGDRNRDSPTSPRL